MIVEENNEEEPIIKDCEPVGETRNEQEPTN